MLVTKMDPDTIVGIVFGIIGAARAVPGVAMIVQHIRNRRSRARNSTGDLETGQSSTRVSSHEDDHMVLLRFLQLGLARHQANSDEITQHPERIAFVHFHHGMPLVTMNSSAFCPFSFHPAAAEDSNLDTGPVSMPTLVAIPDNPNQSATALPSSTAHDATHSIPTTSNAIEAPSSASRVPETSQTMEAIRSIFRSSAGPSSDTHTQTPTFSSSSSTTPIMALYTESRQIDQMNGT